MTYFGPVSAFAPSRINTGRGRHHPQRPKPCEQALDMIDALVLIERKLPSPDLEGDAKLEALKLRRHRRDTDSRLIATKLKLCAEQQTALPRSALAEAIGYLLGIYARTVAQFRRGRCRGDAGRHLGPAPLTSVSPGRAERRDGPEPA